MFPEEMLYIYQLPPRLSDGYCFGPGKPIVFLNVDWFQVTPEQDREELKKFILSKRYIKPGFKYLVLIPSLSETFLVEPDDDATSD